MSWPCPRDSRCCPRVRRLSSVAPTDTTTTVTSRSVTTSRHSQYHPHFYQSLLLGNIAGCDYWPFSWCITEKLVDTSDSSSCSYMIGCARYIQPSSFVYHRIILSPQFVVAMLWSVVQLLRGRLRMVVYVVGSC